MVLRALLPLWAAGMVTWVLAAYLREFLPVWAAQRRLRAEVTAHAARIELERMRRHDQPVHADRDQQGPQDAR